MTQPSALLSMSREFEVEGSGETFEAALQAALKVMRAKALKEAGQPVVYMEPDDIAVLDAESTRRTERFLMLFWPRERRKLTVKFRIKVLMKTVDFSGVEARETAPSGFRFGGSKTAPCGFRADCSGNPSRLHPGRK